MSEIRAEVFKLNSPREEELRLYVDGCLVNTLRWADWGPLSDLATRINDYEKTLSQRDEAAEMLTKIKERLDKTGYLLGGSMDQDLAQICSYLATVDKESGR